MLTGSQLLSVSDQHHCLEKLITDESLSRKFPTSGGFQTWGSRSEVENPALVGNLERVRVRKIRIALWLIEIAVVITHPTSLRRPERADR